MIRSLHGVLSSRLFPSAPRRRAAVAVGLGKWPFARGTLPESQIVSGEFETQSLVHTRQSLVRQEVCSIMTRMRVFD